MIRPALAYKSLTADDPKPIQDEIQIPISAEHLSRLLPDVTTPDFLTPCQDAATQATDTIGTNDLDSLTGTPAFRFATDLGLYTIQCDATDALEATSTNFGDSDASTSISVLALVTLPASLGGSRMIHGNRGAGAGWNLQVSSTGVLTGVLNDGSGSAAPSFAGDHRGRRSPILLVFDRAADLAIVESDLGNDSVSASAIGDASNALPWGIGSANGLLPAETQEYHLVALWEGHALTATERAAIVAHFS